MDTKSINLLQKLHPKVRSQALAAYYEAVNMTPVGVHPSITETYRTFERSNELYAQGRTKPGPVVSASKGGQSYHNYYLALDFVLMVNGKEDWTVNNNWMIVVNTFKAHGFTSGLDWKTSKDAPHLEMRLGYSVKQLLAKYRAKDFITGTNYLNL